MKERVDYSVAGALPLGKQPLVKPGLRAFYKIYIYLTATGFSCGMRIINFSCSMQTLSLQHVGSSSLTRDRTQALCIGSMES